MSVAFAAPAGPPPLLGQLLSVITGSAENAPRSRQTQIGPSEIGAGCRRKTALKLLGAPERNKGDRWAATIGTAVHAWLEEAFAADNVGRQKTGQPVRWLLEEKVTIREGLRGSCDLYDLESDTVVDWKVVGASSLKKYRSAGPSRQYRVQAHTYGVGWANQGKPVKKVAIVFLPRTGFLADTHIWTEDFDPTVCHGALGDLDDLVVGMNVAEHLNALNNFVGLLPRDTDGCRFCPYYTTDRSVAASEGCAGVMEGKQ